MNSMLKDSGNLIHGRLRAILFVARNVTSRSLDITVLEFLQMFVGSLELINLSKEKKEFVCLFNGKEYSAYVQREKIDLARTRLFWDSSLGQALKEYDNPDSYPTAQFTQLDDKALGYW